MARKPTGQVIERERQGGRTFALRFRAYGERHYFTLGTTAEGWTRERAERELSHVLADVERGIWQPPQDDPAPIESRMPTFADYAEMWSGLRAPEFSDSTIERNRYSMAHLLPVFGAKRLDAITPSDVNSYASAKLTEGKLSADSINKTLKLLSQILDYAVEDDELIERNVAKGKRRRLKAGKKPRRTFVGTSDQMAALVDAADTLNRRRVAHGRDRALVTTMLYAGLRISEALALRRRDVDLASSRLRVIDSKTDAGQRDVNLLPVLYDELSDYLARCDLDPDAYMFGTSTGASDNASNVRDRVLTLAVDAANSALTSRGLATMDRITPHSLRRTFCSILLAIGEDPSYVMSQMGHTDPSFTLRVYAQLMRDRSGESQRIKALVNATDWAPLGTKAEIGDSQGMEAVTETPRKPALQAGF